MANAVETVSETETAAPLMSSPHAWGSRLFSIGLMLCCFSGQWDLIGIPLPLDRLFLAIGALLCGYDFLRSRLTIALWKPVHGFMLATSAWALTSSLVAGSLSGSGVFALLDRLVILFALFAIAPVVFIDERDRVFLARTFVVLGVYLGWLAVAQGLELDALVWPRYILDPAVGLHADRARGPYVEAVANGMAMSICIAFSVITVRVDTSTRWRILGGVATAACSVGLVFTLTRAVWIGAALAFLAVGMSVQKWRIWTFPIAGTVGLTLGVLYTTVPNLSSNAEARATDEYPIWDRLNSNAAALRMIEDRPATGIGWHQSANQMSEYIRQGATYPVSASSGSIEIHNVFLSRLAELGAIGFGLWFASFAGAILMGLMIVRSHALQPFRVALLGVTIVWTTAAMLGPTVYVQPNYMLWVLAGIVLSEHLTRRVAYPAKTGRSASTWREREAAL